MLTSLRIQNFKGFEDVTIELGQTVVFIGPNNSGKTTALQALALWYVALQRWQEVMSSDYFSDERIKAGVDQWPKVQGRTNLNRLELNALPIPNTRLLWKNLEVGLADSADIRITVHGIRVGQTWSRAFNFGFANDESLTLGLHRSEDELASFNEANAIQVAFLPPMSGLTATEDRLERGSIQRRIGEGRTAEVLRNLCYQVYESNNTTGNWDRLRAQISSMFGVELLPPNYRSSIGTLEMSYVERSGVTLDLSAAGRGMLQILLLLSYLYTNPGAVLLLDEPDAHLEILRQREVYQLLTTVAREQGSQIIAASHSEVLLNEAADRDVVIAFVGQPHRIDDRSHIDQVRKSLKEIGFEQYYQAEQTGWTLYLEGATDLAILRAFATTLEHPAAAALTHPFVDYTGNVPSKAHRQFQGLRAAKPDLVGFALFDRLDTKLPTGGPLTQTMWQRREIENYLMFPESLIAYANERHGEQGAELMRAVITDFVPPIALRDLSQVWWRDTKASDDFLTPLFKEFYKRLGLMNLMDKTDFHQLAVYVPRELIDPEVTEKLDALLAVARAAKPRGDV